MKNKTDVYQKLKNLYTSPLPVMHDKIACDDNNLETDVYQKLKNLYTSPLPVMHGKIAWNDDNLEPSHRIQARHLIAVIIKLHSHIITPPKDNTFADLKGKLNKLSNLLDPEVIIKNVEVFFEMVQKLWGLDKKNHLLPTQLQGLACFLSEHEIFWKESKLTITTEMMTKLKLFNFTEAHQNFGNNIRILAAQWENLYNRGRRTEHRIYRRKNNEKTI